MVKKAKNLRTDTLESLNKQLSMRKSDCIVTQFETLYGGYSGINYLLHVHDDNRKIETKYVLKICTSYTIADVETQATIMNYLREAGFQYCCAPIPLLHLTSESSYTTLMEDTQPTILLSFLHGKAGDYLVENQLISHEQVVQEIGYGLSQMHQTPLHPSSSHLLRQYAIGGACDANKHISGFYKSLFTTYSDMYITSHPYVNFYIQRIDQMRADLQCQDLPQSVLHGDPFMDNILLYEDSGKISGFVDFEDTCVGPRLFDITCSIVGNCFDESSQFSFLLLKAFLYGYIHSGSINTTPVNKNTTTTTTTHGTLKLTSVEVELFVPFMRYLLICNATFRFWNFNINHPELREEYGTKYLELQQRCEYIENKDIQAQIKAIVHEMNS